MSFCEITGTIFIFSAQWQLSLSNVQSFLSESSPLPLLLFETSQWVTVSCRIDDQDDSDSNDLLLPHTLENLFLWSASQGNSIALREKVWLVLSYYRSPGNRFHYASPLSILREYKARKGICSFLGAVFWSPDFGSPHYRWVRLAMLNFTKRAHSLTPARGQISVWNGTTFICVVAIGRQGQHHFKSVEVLLKNTGSPARAIIMFFPCLWHRSHQ